MYTHLHDIFTEGMIDFERVKTICEFEKTRIFMFLHRRTKTELVPRPFPADLRFCSSRVFRISRIIMES